MPDRRFLGKTLFWSGVPLIIITAVILETIPLFSVTPVSLEGLSEDQYYMAMAFAEIGKMLPEEGWPVGAIVVRNNEILGRAANKLFATNDPTQHAESIAIDQAIAAIKQRYPRENYRFFFEDATIYVTLEPCPMDAGKITMLKFKRVVICDLDEIWGAFGSVNNLAVYPNNISVLKSDLAPCQQLRDIEGWNHPELWELGKLYAASTGQTPSLLSYILRKIYEIFI